MGANRKLQLEIDRVLKKVQEGVDIFDNIWNKLYDTDNANLKEKLEMELKKEIKKLQRYRDQIKTWQQASEIKDKKALVDARKLVEREMERFKICERETKLKAFSKEALDQQPKADPKEKAKSETRHWLNNVVGELETQIDVFEAEIEGFSIKKGKTKPPRLAHLETSIARHKAHIMKLELILRLLDNEELTPEQVNDVREFLEDYVERNQEDFDEFSDVDELYSTLPLDKVESLEDLVTIGPPNVVKGAPLNLKTSAVASPIPQAMGNATGCHPHGSPAQERVGEKSPQDGSSPFSAKIQPVRNSLTSSQSALSGSNATPVASSISSHGIAASFSTGTSLLSSAVFQGSLDSAASPLSSAPMNLSNLSQDEEKVKEVPPSISPPRSEASILQGIGTGNFSGQTPSSIPPLSSEAATIKGALDTALRSDIGGPDDNLGLNSVVQLPASPLVSTKTVMSHSAKDNDGNPLADSGSAGDSATRSLSSSVLSSTSLPWRPGSSFVQNEQGQFRGRPEIEPDQREKFLQRFQQVKQQSQNNFVRLPSPGAGIQKQLSSYQQNQLLQQYSSPSSAVTPQPVLNTGVFTSLQQQSTATHPLSSPLTPPVLNDSDGNHAKAEEHLQQQNVPDDATAESANITGMGNNIFEDDVKSLNFLDSPAVPSASLKEPLQVPREIDLSPRHPLSSPRPSGTVGVIGRRSPPDAFGGPTMTSNGGMHDKLHYLRMLDTAFLKRPLPQDSEIYIPKNPVVTPSSYPQVPAPFVRNHGFWEKLALDRFPLGIDILFFAFYHQQNTYQQYMAAKQLKKLSWRYHKRYNSWFKRLEEPKITTDEFEQGTYMYFDYLYGWSQRVKRDFVFEYKYLEDELK